MLSLTLPIKSMNPLRKRIYCRHLYRSAESFLQRESWSTTKENSKFILVEDKTRPGSVVVFKARNSLSLFANCYLQILKISYTEFHKTKYWSHYFSYNIYIYIYIYIQSVCIHQLFCSLKAHQYISTAQIKRRSWRTRVLKLLLEL